METKNAIITDAEIIIEDHGLLSAWVYLDYNGAGQGFGGYCLYSPAHDKKESKNYTGLFIWQKRTSRRIKVGDIAGYNNPRG